MRLAMALVPALLVGVCSSLTFVQTQKPGERDSAGGVVHDGLVAVRKDRNSSEGRQRLVAIAKPFAVGQFAVTFDEWDTCIADCGVLCESAPCQTESCYD